MLQVQEYIQNPKDDVAATIPNIEVGLRANQSIINYRDGFEPQIENIYGYRGASFDYIVGGTYPSYDPSLFDNRGGIVANSSIQRLMANANIPANCMAYGVFEMPLNPTSHCEIFGFGTTDINDIASARFMMLSSNGNLLWYNNDGGTFSVNLGGDYRGQRVAYIIEYQNGFANFYINDGTTPLVTNADIFDGYINRERLIVGGEFTQHAEMWLSHATFNDIDITPEQLMNDLKLRWGLTVISS